MELSNATLRTATPIAENASEFGLYLAHKGHLTSDKLQGWAKGSGGSTRLSLRLLWEASELSSSEFADEAARYFQLERITLAELAKTRSLTSSFAPRFLREAAIFPFQFPGEPGFRLAVGDPADRSFARSAELALGGAVEIVVASFEDIAAALNDRLSAD